MMKLLLLLVLLIFPVFVFGQCPACSNPALQSNERVDFGIDTLFPGTFRINSNITYGMNYRGGHPAERGVTSEGVTIAVPHHEHIVDLDIFRKEVGLEYTFLRNTSLWFRIPYEIKQQKTSLVIHESATEEQIEAMKRNSYLHHRNETYSGFGDLKLLASRRIHGVFKKDRDLIDLALGFSIPTGRTEEDPLQATERNEKHLHLQFGTGTIDPVLEIQFLGNLSDRLTMGVFTMHRVSFYENAKGYLGPYETTSGASLIYGLYPKISLRATAGYFHQNFAYWNGIKDYNSGLNALNATFGATYRTGSFAVTPSFRLPVYQKTLLPEGDAFSFGPTLMLNTSFVFEKE